MRIAKSLLTFFFVVAVTAMVICSLGLYLALTNRSLPLLRALVTRIGHVVEGQHTDRLEIDVRLQPSASRLAATARLSVRALTADRHVLYFLLNDRLRVHRVAHDVEGGSQPLTHYHLGPILAVRLPRPLAKDEAFGVVIDYDGSPLGGGLGASAGLLNASEVLLETKQLWYPADLQSFFVADVRVLLPADLTLLHNGREEERERRGNAVRVRWTTTRPVAGLALVAGRYEGMAEAGRYRVAVAPGIDLDPQQLVSALQDSDRVLTERYGASGFGGLMLFVSRGVERAFHDGSGLIGVSPARFRGGDYGFALIAHEVAHSWWGATVAERWLQPGSGGEWIVEGFAELSSWIAVADRFGSAGLLRRLEETGYDPARSGVLQAMSALDNGLDPQVRETIYHKGPLVARLLMHLAGEEKFFAAARQLIERFHHRQANDADVEAVFAEVTQQDVRPFFETWVRSDASFDVALDPQDGGAVARNHGTAWAPPTLVLERFASGAKPDRQTVALGAATPLGNAERLLLDPDGAVPDMYRANNVFPQRPNPRAVATSPRGDLLVVYGEPYPWAPATVTQMRANGEVLHAWELDRGVALEPRWAADGLRILAVETDRNGVVATLALNGADGSRTTLVHDAATAVTAQHTIVARGDRLLRMRGNESTTLARHPGRRLGTPLVSPDEAHVAYASTGERDTELRVATVASGADALLFTWDRCDVRWQWAPDGSAVFAVLPGDWDWQLWEIPLGSGTPRALVREAAGMGGLAVAPDGRAIAIAASASLDYAHERREVFVLDRAAGSAERYGLGDETAHGVAWLDGDSLLVVVSAAHTLALPRQRELRRLRLHDGSLTPFP